MVSLFVAAAVYIEILVSFQITHDEDYRWEEKFLPRCSNTIRSRSRHTNHQYLKRFLSTKAVYAAACSALLMSNHTSYAALSLWMDLRHEWQVGSIFDGGKMEDFCLYSKLSSWIPSSYRNLRMQYLNKSNMPSPALSISFVIIQNHYVSAYKNTCYQINKHDISLFGSCGNMLRAILL